MPMNKEPDKDPREPLLRLGGDKWNIKIYTPLGLLLFCAMIGLGIYFLSSKMDVNVCFGNALTASSYTLPLAPPR